MILLFLAFFLASGTVADPIAHAVEVGNEGGVLVSVVEAGCLSSPVIDRAEVDQDNSSSGEKTQLPVGGHACHGHYSGVLVETPALQSDVLFPVLHPRALTAALPPVAYIATFRPPIS